MNLKRAILAELGRDDLKRLADELELDGVDRRSVEALRAALSKARRATPAVLVEALSETQVKAVCQAVGASDIGRRRALIERLLSAPSSPLPATTVSPLPAAGEGPGVRGQDASSPAEINDGAAAQGRGNPSTHERGESAAADRLTQGRSGMARARTEGAEEYRHPQAEGLARPDVGTQAQFRKRKAPARYAYDSSLSPALEWDGQNHAREEGEALIAEIQRQAAAVRRADNDTAREAAAAALQTAAEKLAALARPFLNWAGKAERTSFDVPTLPLFVHERLSTKAILETLTGHRRRSETQATLWDLFADPQRSIADQTLRAYEYADQWTNRLVLGDSLVVMNSLVRYEGLAGQVQMIYMDPPYGVKFGSNFQPFVRKRDVKHNDDEDFTREPEMVQAYRDTWELGLHSYLTYLRDRLLLSRELLAPTGSIFVQISDENLHHVRELMDEVFGHENFFAQINFRSMTALGQKGLACVYDYILWYAKDIENAKFRPLFVERPLEEEPEFSFIDQGEGKFGKLSREDILGLAPADKKRVFKRSDLTSSGYTESCTFKFEFEGKAFEPRGGKSWRTHPGGIETLIAKHRLFSLGKRVYFRQYHADFSLMQLENSWHDTAAGFSEPKMYVVQTNNKVLDRCMLMTTDPGDLVLDPTCGSGTTPYVAEAWGRRWIAIDVSRVPLALARQRLLTATFPWYELADDERGPAGGFVYKRRQNRKGEEVGGIVPHVTLKSIANNEPPAEEVLVDRPEEAGGITRVTGPFCFEATIPTPVEMEGEEEEQTEKGTTETRRHGEAEDSGATATSSVPPLPAAHDVTSVSPLPAAGEGSGVRGPESTSRDGAAFVDRMLEVLRRSPLLRLEGNRTVKLHNVRPPARSLVISAEALVDATAEGQQPSLADLVEDAVEQDKGLLRFTQKPVAFVFGPENGAVSERLVFEAAREAYAKSYTHLYVIGFAIQPHARNLIERCGEVVGVPATYVQATPDLLMGDLLKNMRSSQIFSVCGQPDVAVKRVKEGRWQAQLRGLDVFDPVTMEAEARRGDDVPCWLLDTDYNDLCFHVCQAFFPRTAAWDNLRRALKGQYADSVWDHLAGAESAPFEAGDHARIAVKVIDDRGNELMVVKDLKEDRR